MTTQYLLALSNPVSRERDAEFNDWYNNTHLAEVTALPGFKSAKRFRTAASQLMPGEPTYRYLALYELTDSVQAVRALIEQGPHLQPSTAIDPAMLVAVFEEIHAHPAG